MNTNLIDVTFVVQQCITQYNEAHNTNIPLDVKVRLSNKMTRCGGTFTCHITNIRGERTVQDSLITISLHYLTEHRQQTLQQTIPHEVAHYISMYIHKTNVGHGPEWQRTMHSLGVPPLRLHNMKLTTTVRTYKYTCGCKTFTLSQRQHRDNRQRRCLTCNNNLQLIVDPN